ncbi:hypothetical protein HMPREF9069_00820 [Atopobium sp. oral taxon 810 str. F0209]|nr:hypothetical protein HMPREF9069_00820 [Atopobium sp. oral taxon 810 str. F0209]
MVLLAKRHILFQKKCQKPHSISKSLTFAQVDFSRVKRGLHVFAGRFFGREEMCGFWLKK